MFTEEFLRRVEVASKSDTVNPMINILLKARWEVAGNIHEGVNPETEQWYINKMDSLDHQIAIMVGLAPELAKDESDKPIGRMKCVKCDLIKTGDVCECGGTEFKVVEDGEFVWLGGKK